MAVPLSSTAHSANARTRSGADAGAAASVNVFSKTAVFGVASWATVLGGAG